MSMQSFVPALKPLDRAAIMLVSTLLFFLFKVLTVKELEDIPWNIILLFSGAMSIGFCLWQTGAANGWLSTGSSCSSMPMACLCLKYRNIRSDNDQLHYERCCNSYFIPVSLVIAPYLGVAPDVIFYSSLITAGMPFVLLIGAAPNAIPMNQNSSAQVNFSGTVCS